MLVTVALLAIYTGVAGWEALKFHSWQDALFALVAAVACVGAALLRSWSQFLVYLLAACLIASWLYSIHAAQVLGYFRIFSRTRMFLMLAPEAVLLLLSGYCSYAVYRQFRR